MQTTLSLWNRALGFIGTRTVASENENTQEAVQCRLYWDSARRGALRDAAWPFAQRRKWLAQVAPPEGFEHSHAFALPHDCLKVHGIENVGAGSARPFLGSARTIPYILAYDATAQRQVVLCDAPAALLAYSADVTQVALFDDLFAHALTRKLAALIAVPLLKNNSQKMQELETLYRQSLADARLAAVSESPPIHTHDTWLISRATIFEGCIA